MLKQIILILSFLTLFSEVLSITPEYALCIKLRTLEDCLNACSCGYCNFTVVNTNVTFGLCFHSEEASVCLDATNPNLGIYTAWISSADTDTCKSIHRDVNLSIIITVSILLTLIAIGCIVICFRNHIKRCWNFYKSRRQRYEVIK